MRYTFSGSFYHDTNLTIKNILFFLQRLMLCHQLVKSIQGVFFINKSQVLGQRCADIAPITVPTMFSDIHKLSKCKHHYSIIRHANRTKKHFIRNIFCPQHTETSWRFIKRKAYQTQTQDINE